jgi:hypothetical protein
MSRNSGRKSTYMQPTACHNSRLRAKQNGFELADDFHDSHKEREHTHSRGINYWNNTPSVQKRKPKYYLQNAPVFEEHGITSSPLAKKARESLLLSNGDSYQHPDEEQLQLRKLLEMYSNCKHEKDKQDIIIQNLEDKLEQSRFQNEQSEQEIRQLQEELGDANAVKDQAALIPKLVEAGEKGEREREHLEAAIEMYQNLEMNQERTIVDAINVTLPMLDKLANVCPTINNEVSGMKRGLNTSASPIIAIASIFKRTSHLLLDEIFNLRDRVIRVEDETNDRATSAPLKSTQDIPRGFSRPSTSPSYLPDPREDANTASTIEHYPRQVPARIFQRRDPVDNSYYDSTRANRNPVHNMRSRMYEHIKNLDTSPTQKQRSSQSRKSNFVV